jgi:hypothetical protein
MKLQKSYTHLNTDENAVYNGYTQLWVVVDYDMEEKEFDIEQINIVKDGKIVADIFPIIHNHFSEMINKIYNDDSWYELALQNRAEIMHEQYYEPR